jgi:hypothetical protein
MSRKKAKKAVKKVVSSKVWWVPSASEVWHGAQPERFFLLALVEIQFS